MRSFANDEDFQLAAKRHPCEAQKSTTRTTRRRQERRISAQVIRGHGRQHVRLIQAPLGHRALELTS